MTRLLKEQRNCMVTALSKESFQNSKNVTNNVLAMDDNKNIFIAFMKKYKDNKWIWGSNNNFGLSHLITPWFSISKTTGKIEE